jgi:hypothetical protein
MSAPPPLPPPPPVYGSVQSQPSLPPTPSRPGWRQGRPGYILLNLVIGFGISIGMVVLLGILIAIFRPDADAVEANDALSGWAFLLAFLGGLVGWIFFAYQESSLRQRWIVFGSIVGGTMFVSLLLLIRAVDIGGGTF